MATRFVMELSSKGTKSVGLFIAIGVLVFLFGPTTSSTALAEEERISVVISPAQEVAWGEKALESFLETRRLSGDGNLALRID